MKAAFLAGCLLLTVVAAEPQSGVAGKWMWQGPGGWQRVSLDLKVSGTELGGLIEMGPEAVQPGEAIGPDSFWRLFFVPAVFELEDGKVSGNRVSFQHEPPVGSPDKLSYTGELSGNTLKLTRRYSRRSDGTVGNPQFEFILERAPGGLAQGFPARSPSGSSSLAARVAQTRSVDVRVTNANGQPASNLSINDFVLEEGGEPQRIRHLDSMDSAWNLLLLIELRRLTISAEATALAETLEPFLSRLRPQDRVAIAAFDHKVETLLNWKSFRVGEKRKVDLKPAPRYIGINPAPGFVGAKDLYGAVQWATTKMKDLSGRKAVIVLTDGLDARLVPPGFMNTSGKEMIIDPLFGLPDFGEATDFEATIQSVRQSGIRVHILAINPKVAIDEQINTLYPGAREASGDYLKRVGSRIQRMTGSSGGQTLNEETPSSAIQRFGRLYDDLGLGTSYTLEYVSSRSPVDDTYRKPEVRVGDPVLRVHLSQEGLR